MSSSWYRAHMATSGAKVEVLRIFCLLIFFDINKVQSAPATSSLRMSSQESACNFNGAGRRNYSISDFLQCMNQLASSTINLQGFRSRSLGDLDRSYRIFAAEGKQYSEFSPEYPGGPFEDSFPQYDDGPDGPYFPQDGPTVPQHYQGPPTQSNFQQGSGFYPPSELGFPNPPGIGFNPPERPGIGLFNALTSIAQFDDQKCVPRLLCEVATGSKPGGGDYKQAGSTLEDLGKNALFGLLTAFDFGDSSPVLLFAKAALLGYTSKGDPSTCYQEFTKCPSNPRDLVHYLNNHNGGFFRFFSNIGNAGIPQLQRPYISPEGGYRLARKQPAPPPGISGPESDRTGTGELKFDTPVPSSRRGYGKSFFPGKRTRNESIKVVFPDPKDVEDIPALIRVSKSLPSVSDGSTGHRNEPSQGNPSFFPEQTEDQETLHQPLKNENTRSIVFPKARLYVPNDAMNVTTSTFTFPDGEKLRINVSFSKLFTEGYKDIRKSYSKDQFPEPLSFEGFSMINLADIVVDAKGLAEVQLGHPCDMICHDVRGTTVQFSQILTDTGTLSTLMTPESPTLDLSKPVPCEIVCIDRRGDRRQISTDLSQVLRSNNENSVTTY